MSKIKIITHPGKAHRDDYLSCCLLLFHLYPKGTVTIERRSVNGDELADRNIWVVDTGRQHQPHYRNFDHHQNSPDMKGRCALDLVCDFVFDRPTIELARENLPWMKVSSVHDCYGAAGAAQFLEISPFQYLMCMSPVEKWSLDTFASQTRIEVTSATYSIMLEIGRRLYDSIIKLKEQKASLDRLPDPVVIGDNLKYWDTRGDVLDGTTESNAMLNKRAKELEVQALVSHSTRTEGPSIFIPNNSAHLLSVNLIENEPDVFFAHGNGHFAILHDTVSNPRLRELLLQCLVNPPTIAKSKTTPTTRPRGRFKNKIKK